MFSEEYQRWGWPEPSISIEGIHKHRPPRSSIVKTPALESGTHGFGPLPYALRLAPVPAPQQRMLYSPFAPPVRQSTHPPIHAYAPPPALTYPYLFSPHSLSPLPSSRSVPQPPSFPIPSVPGGYSASGEMGPPSPPMTERATATYECPSYQNVATLGISHQQSAAVGRSHRACIVSGVAENYT